MGKVRRVHFREGACLLACRLRPEGVRDLQGPSRGPSHQGSPSAVSADRDHSGERTEAGSFGAHSGERTGAAEGAGGSNLCPLPSSSLCPHGAAWVMGAPGSCRGGPGGGVAEGTGLGGTDGTVSLPVISCETGTCGPPTLLGLRNWPCAVQAPSGLAGRGGLLGGSCGPGGEGGEGCWERPAGRAGRALSFHRYGPGPAQAPHAGWAPTEGGRQEAGPHPPRCLYPRAGTHGPRISDFI